MENKFEVIVVGAGIVGTAMASALGKAGRKVLLIGETAAFCDILHS